MRFLPTRLPGAVLVEPEPIADARGAFMRTFCEREFSANGLPARFVQHSRSMSRLAGTVRGLHFQRPPHAEAKVVTCLHGAIWDVVVDLRAGSATRGQWQAFELTAGNRRALYVPRGFAHGFQTLVPDSEVSYLISDFHVPDAGCGITYDAPWLAIGWPLPVSATSERDRSWPEFDDDWIADGDVQAS